jgi:hypothetical protein
MVNSQNQLYSKVSAAAILKLQPREIDRVEVWPNVVYVNAHRLSRFVSMTDFKKIFVERRKKGAADLKVINAPMIGGYVVKNEKKGTNYIVTPYKDRIECACEDYGNQLRLNPETLGTKHACCKHVYAVLNYLGHKTLKEYLEAQ